MGRIYTAPIKELSIAGPVDLASIYMNSNNAVARIRRIWLALTNTTLPTAQQLEMLLSLYSAATQGSGGTTPTPNPEDPGDSASSATLHVGDTVASSGTLAWQWPDGMYVFTGRDLVLSFDLVVPKTYLFVFRCPSTPTGATPPIVNGGVEWEEIGK